LQQDEDEKDDGGATKSGNIDAAVVVPSWNKKRVWACGTKHNKTYLRVTAGWPDGSYVVHCNALKLARGTGAIAWQDARK